MKKKVGCKKKNWPTNWKIGQEKEIDLGYKMNKFEDIVANQRIFDYNVLK